MDARRADTPQSSTFDGRSRTTVKRLMVTILAAALAVLYGQRLPAQPSQGSAAAAPAPAVLHR
jgi:hypothetical protein